jgi:hypothetical protein
VLLCCSVHNDDEMITAWSASTSATRPAAFGARAEALEDPSDTPALF